MVSRVLNSLPSDVTLQAAQSSEQKPPVGYAGGVKANHFNQLSPGFDEGGLNLTRRSADYESFRGVAVDVFKTQNLSAIQSLKKFLAALPGPSYIRRVLLEAVYQLAEEDPAACRWLIHHRHALEPELDLLRIVQSVAQERLQNRGLKLNQDFSFTSEGQLQANNSTITLLIEETSAGDRLLLEEILLLR